jgi:CBS domain-containing protein
MEEKNRNGHGEERGSTGGAGEGRMAAAAADQRSSFYERAARRVGERGQPPRGDGGRSRDDWQQPRSRPEQPSAHAEQRRSGAEQRRSGAEQPRSGAEQPRSRAEYEASRTGWGGGNLGPSGGSSQGQGGGFGQGGYGSYGAPHSSDAWSPATRPGPGEAGDDGETSFGRGESAWGGQFGGEARDRDNDRNRDRTRERRSRWQREAITAGEIMTSSPRAATRETSLQEVAHIMKEENCGAVPVLDGNRRLVGMVTDRDLVVRAAAENKTFAATRVGEIMTDDVEAVTPDEELTDVIELMGKKQVRRVPVVDKDDRLLGIISMGDIANRADYDEELQAALERVSSKRSFWSRLWT